jgi:branched-subunit amino acid transport protein AzlD
MRIHHAISLTALAGALMAISFEVYAASGLRFLSHRTGLLMTLWTVLPYVVIFAGRFFFDCIDVLKRWLRFSLFEVLVVAWIYWQTLVMYPDAQGSLIFLFLPLLQASLNLLVGAIFYWLQYRLKQKSESKTFKA